MNTISRFIVFLTSENERSSHQCCQTVYLLYWTKEFLHCSHLLNGCQYYSHLLVISLFCLFEFISLYICLCQEGVPFEMYTEFLLISTRHCYRFNIILASTLLHVQCLCVFSQTSNCQFILFIFFAQNQRFSVSFTDLPVGGRQCGDNGFTAN